MPNLHLRKPLLLSTVILSGLCVLLLTACPPPVTVSVSYVCSSDQLVVGGDPVAVEVHISQHETDPSPAGYEWRLRRLDGGDGSLGGVASPVVTGWIFDQTGDYQVAFISMLVLAAISLLLMLSLRRTNKLQLAGTK